MSFTGTRGITYTYEDGGDRGCTTALAPFLAVGQGLEHSAWAEGNQAIQDSLPLAQSEMAEPTVETNAGNPLDASEERMSFFPSKNEKRRQLLRGLSLLD